MIGTPSAAARAQLRTMLACRKSICRGLASVAANPSHASSSPSPSPSSSSSSSSSASAPSTSWRPPIEPGVEPAFDEALKLIADHQAQLRRAIPTLEKDVQRTQAGTVERLEAEAKLYSHVVASQIDDPAVRWRFENDANVPLDNPVYAHLREKLWRTDYLPRATQRLTTMGVVPDVLPTIVPTVDVRIFFGEGEGIDDRGGKGGNVMIGCFVEPEKTFGAPGILAQPFHTEERLYTIALVDADAPYEAQDRLGPYAHWLLHNVPLSVTKNVVEAAPANVALPYVPPHPQRGTAYHRYTVVVLEQVDGKTIAVQSSAAQADIEATHAARKHFSVNALVDQHNLRPAGIHFWREVWTKETAAAVSKVYNDVLRQQEPKFVRLNA